MTIDEVDSYAFLPRAFRPLYEAEPWADHEPVWAPFAVPLSEARVALLSSAGIHVLDEQEPFDVERERREPSWGDPTSRVIPADVTPERIGVNHLHINTTDIEADIDVALPVHRLTELVGEGLVGEASPVNFSVMGYQEHGAEVWRTRTGPDIASRCHAADIDALILAPA